MVENMRVVPVSRFAQRLHRRFRQARMLARAFKFPHQPVNAHLIATRRCNLACAYCNEFDKVSPPVSLEELIRRVDCLGTLGTGVVTISGGEPMLHPDLDRVIARIRARGMIATVITNGYLLTRGRIERLNAAGLDHLQISIDNVAPDAVSMKSLNVLDRKLQLLALHARFDITINAVVGAGTECPDDALMIAERARALGFSATVGIIHGDGGRLRPLDDGQRAIVERIASLQTSRFAVATYSRFQKNLAAGRPNAWQCGAGARYLYVCEDGLVHWCSQQRGRPGIPLERYSQADLQREHAVVKSCASFCTIGCAHRVAQLDELRADPAGTLAGWFSPETGAPGSGTPTSIRLLLWMFVTGPHREMFRRAAQRVLNAG
jgi:MoaA/NifB/PqqE/SkfB family radical SAM enzyme